MPQLLAQHVDAVISLAAGLFGSIYAYWPGIRPGNASRQRALKALKICGPVVILFGILQFFINQTAAPVWQRHSTTDGVASAEFPAPPESKVENDTINGVTTPRTTLMYNVPFKNISLFLSFSPIADAAQNIPDADRFAAVRGYFVQQGFAVEHEGPVQLGSSPGYSFDLSSDKGKTRMWARIAHHGNNVYRVVAASAGSYHNDPIIAHFLDSFRINTAPDGAR